MGCSEAVADPQDHSLGKALSRAPCNGAGAGSGRNIVLFPCIHLGL